MGMCMCTMIGCPTGLGVGSCAFCCCPTRELPPVMMGGVNTSEMVLFAAIFAASFVFLYLPLTVLCTRADQASYMTYDKTTGDVSWSIYPSGECWSEGGLMPYSSLGLLTGFLLGFSFMGFIIATCRTLWPGNSRQEAKFDMAYQRDDRGDGSTLRETV